MAFFKAILFAVLAISLQSTEGSPRIVNKIFAVSSEQDHSAESSEELSFFDSLREKGDHLIIADKAKVTLATAVLTGQLRLDQAKDVLVAVFRDAAKGKLSNVAALDIALEQLVKEKLIDKNTKTRILIAFIRTADSKNASATLKDNVAAAAKAAVEAGEITQEVCDKIISRAPEKVKVDPRATTSAYDVQQAVKGATDPVSIRKDIRLIAEKGREALLGATKAGYLTPAESKEVIDLIWNAAKSNEITNLSKVGIAMDTCVAQKVIDYPTKVKILMVVIKTGTYKNLSDKLPEAVATFVDTGVKAKVITPEVGAKLKETAPSTIDTKTGYTPSDKSVVDALEK